MIVTFTEPSPISNVICSTLVRFILYNYNNLYVITKLIRKTPFKDSIRTIFDLYAKSRVKLACLYKDGNYK